MERRNPVQLFHKHLSLTLVLMVLLSFSTAEQDAFSAKTDAQALLKFKKMIQSDPNGVLSGWELSKSLCTWYGVSCSLGRVTQLDLSGCALRGTISLDPFASLNMLSVLKLASNSFTVNSTSMLQLPYGLKQLDLSLAGLVGSLPESLFSKCPNLANVNLAFNNLTGFFPENLLLSADKLQSLEISYNNLTGSISGMNILENSCQSLLVIDLSGNRLMGSIPSALSNCTNLQSIDFSINSLTGEIPKDLGELKNLQRMDLSQNQITGWIPNELGSACKSLLELKLANNNISGVVPSSFSSCSWLQVLDLSNNNISGPLPDSLFQSLGSLDSLILSNNIICLAND